MNLTPKLELTIKIFCILILIILNIAVWYNGKDLNCNKCIIHFQSSYEEYKNIYDKPMQDFNANITDLFDSYKKGDCLVKWTNGGYIYDKSIK